MNVYRGDTRTDQKHKMELAPAAVCNVYMYMYMCLGVQ